VATARALDRARKRRDVVMHDYARSLRSQAFRVHAFSLVGNLAWAAAVLVTMVGSCVAAGAYEDYLEESTGPQVAKKLVTDFTGTSIGLDDTHIYWHMSVRGVKSLAKAGGKPTLLCEDKRSKATGYSMVVDAAHVYWVTTKGEVLRCPKGGGKVASIGRIDGIARANLRVAGDASHLYATTPHRIVKVTKQSGEVVTLADEQTKPSEIVVDDQHVYWFDDRWSLEKKRYLRRVAKKGGKVATLDGRESIRDSVRPAVDGQYIYYVANYGNAIDRVPKAGGKRQRIARSKATDVDQLALDDTHVYFATRYDSLGCSGTAYGQVRRVPKEGGPVETLDTGLKTPLGIEVDRSHVYWADLYRDTLMRMPKPTGS